MNQWVLVGHRGVGKSSLLRELKKHFPQFQCTSLDQYIVDQSSRSIENIFSGDGESEFRKIEKDYCAQFIRENSGKNFILDLGAGFQGQIPSGINVLWVKRKSSSPENMFLDRPNLGGSIKMDPERFQKREERYDQVSDLSIELREGEGCFRKGEKTFFETLFENKKIDPLKGFCWTVGSSSSEIEKKLMRNLGACFEYRDDLVDSYDFIQPGDIYSFRKNKEWSKVEYGQMDWPLEWGTNEEASIESLHTREEDIEDTFNIFSSLKNHKKLAIPIHSFSDLIECHNWMMDDFENRSFLPMSEEGRWSWYREFISPKINFLRLGEGSASDQPTVFEILNAPKDPKNFAAILGSPVAHSFTPTFHQEFFNKENAPVLKIDVAENEFDIALPFLKELGLRWAAVTSPLKLKAGQLVGVEGPVNTLCFKEQWHGANTDSFGLEELLEEFKNKKIAVWGGGGVLDSIESVLPQATFYSSRTGGVKKGEEAQSPEVILWGVGAKNFKEKGVFPPSHWSIQWVVDLNYTQDSPGLESAYNYGCQYRSGLGMFQAQAEKQQEFWRECGI